MTNSTRHNSTDPLDPTQEQVLTALAAGASVTEAARLAGIHRSTIHNWLKDPAFATQFDTIRQEYAESMKDTLRDLSRLALEALRTVLESPATPPSVRLKAALAVLQRPAFPARGWNLPSPENTPQQEARLQEAEEMEAEFRYASRRDAIAKIGKNAVISHAEAHARSAPCPCGSGRKYKRCCGVGAPPRLGGVAA